MTGLLGLALPPWLNPTLLGAVALSVAAGSGGAYIDHKFMAGSVATAKLETASVQATYEAYKSAVAANAAKDTAAALAQQTALTASNNALQAQLQDTQRIADARSQSLKAILTSAKPGDTRALGPNVLAYVDGLRKSQAGRTANPGSP